MSKGWAEFVAHAATFEAALETVQMVRTATRELFEQLNSAVRTEASGKRDILDGKLRYDENTPVFSSCADAIEAFTSSVSLMIAAVEDIKMIVSGVSSGQLADREETIIELEKSQVDLQAVVNDFEMLIAARGSNVYWFEYSDNGYSYSLKIQSAPLDIAEKLSVGLYDHMETVVMASATLTVARDFSYISKRLGLDLDSRERVREFIATSPFDYPRQAAVIVPSFLPSPKHEKFIEQTNDVLYRIATEIGRGMLVLFTSRGHLHRSYHELKDPLTRKGLTLMGQGIDGSRNLLVRRFREDKRSILFGTDSFWEGVDVPGSALEIVVIMKLPFAVPADPVVQAQLEEVERAGGNPFMDYSVPEAAIRLRQGAGRLIRHRGDRGIVVVLDNRIVTARYGETFKRCLPGTFIKTDSTDNLIKSMSAWFGE
jgi:Rad3-related DNA helicase